MKGKIGRNDLCSCGSGKKYKRCCLKDKEKIHELVDNYKEYDSDSIKSTIKEIEFLKNGENNLNATIQIAQLYQKLGQHSEALAVLETIQTENVQEEITIKMTKAISYQASGQNKEAIKYYLEIFDNLPKLKMSDIMIAGLYLEAGKAFSSNNDVIKAIEYWEKAASLFKDKDDESYARTLSNIGSSLLHFYDKDSKERGMQLIEYSSKIKYEIGDLKGLSTNYCNLGLYYLKEGKYQLALVYLRWDLKASKMIPDKLNLGLAIANLAQLYIILLQLTEARIKIRELMEIAKGINSDILFEKASLLTKQANEIGKLCGEKGIKIGKKAECVCASGKIYEDCCGQADHEPQKLPWDYNQILSNTEELDSAYKDLRDNGIKPFQLDFILRKSDDAKGRLSWNSTEFRNGWIKYSEIPDMANQHLGCAESLADELEKEDDIAKCISCLILCACALEAFINQVAFFVYDTKSSPQGSQLIIPKELEAGVMEFERHTELILKWHLLGKCICGKYWDDRASIINDFKDLIFVRNELVHFKSTEFEQLIPPPKDVPEVIKRLKGKIEFREIKGLPLSWPRKIMTKSLAKWSIKTADGLIDYFKDAYNKNRLDQKNTVREG